MEPNEKAERLSTMLQGALQPLMDKIDKLEDEIKVLQEGQEELRKTLSEK